MFETVVHKFLRIPYALHIHVDQKPRRSRATVLLLHGIGDSGATWDALVAALPDDIRVISVDLLGFGQSPAPGWLKYNIRVQAQSVVATLFGRGVRRPVIIIGHSMGSLTAIEIARRYPLLVRSLILCSPPLYSDDERRRLLPNPNKLLRAIYQLMVDNPKTVVDISSFVDRLKITGSAFHITRDNVAVFMSALEAGIIDQTALDDVQKIRKPIRLIHGRLDPLVIKANLKTVVGANPSAQLTVVRGAHEMNGAYVKAITAAVAEHLGV